MPRHVSRTSPAQPSSRSFPVLLLPALLAAVLLAPPAPAAELPPPEHEETRNLMALVAEAVEEVEAHGVEAACEKFHQADSRWFHGEVWCC